MYLVLDLHGELFMINEDDTLDLVLASSTDEKLMKKYDYVMFGRVFKFETSTIKDEEMTSVLISYGGLIMRLTASPQQLKPIEPDSDVYLLLRKK
jgi:DNA-directed RNA polymerase I, II, and III subunit RPABC3